MKYIRRQGTDTKSAIQTIVIRKQLLLTFLMIAALVGVISGITNIRRISSGFDQQQNKSDATGKRD